MSDSPNRFGPNTNPELLHQLFFSFVPSRVLTTGVQLHVFAHIASGKQTAEEVARAAKTSRRGMRMLLDALVGCGLLSKKSSQTGANKTAKKGATERTVQGDRYVLSPLAARFLVRGKPDYLGATLETDGFFQIWSQLPDVVRRGKPAKPVNKEALASSFFPALVSMLHILNREPARKTAEVLGAARSRKPLNVVDVACGSGVWGIAFAEADRRARITAQDFSAMLEETRLYLKRHRVEDQFDFLAGDLKQVDFGKNRFDVALLGNIVHSEGERSSRNLFRRLYRALRPGGKIAIVDMIPNDRRTGPPFPLFFALNMLLHWEEGDTYTLAEYKRWLTDAGFTRVKPADIGSHSPLIIASRP
jgi:ubiquinone/menaquinone biosynthesis C-methylase UbiE